MDCVRLAAPFWHPSKLQNLSKSSTPVHCTGMAVEEHINLQVKLVIEFWATAWRSLQMRPLCKNQHAAELGFRQAWATIS